MGRRGQYKRGETLRGDLVPKVLSGPTQTLQFNTPTATVTGSGSVGLPASTQTYEFRSGLGTPRGQHKRGEAPRGGQIRRHQIEPTVLDFAASTQTLQFDTPTATVTGTGAVPLGATEQTLQFNTPTATVTGSGTVGLPASTQTYEFRSRLGTPRGQHKRGEAPRGGQIRRHQIEPTVLDFAASTQTLQFDTPTATVTGTGAVPLGATEQTLQFDTPTAAIGYTEWALGGEPIPSVTDELTTYQRLALQLRAETSVVTDHLRALKATEGKVDVLTRDDGGYTAKDRANGSNTYTITPPVTRQDLRQSGDLHVAKYEESVVSQAVDEWDVDLELIYDENRTDSPSISETRASDEWAFNTRYGQIATDRVDAEAIGLGTDGVKRFEVTARFDFEQAHVWEAALNRLAGSRVRQIQDSDNVLVDETASTVNTITVTSPTSGSEVPDGDYVVTEWESEQLNDRFQEVSFVLGKT